MVGLLAVKEYKYFYVREALYEMSSHNLCVLVLSETFF
jgi:hypothetical protein